MQPNEPKTNVTLAFWNCNAMELRYYCNIYMKINGDWHSLTGSMKRRTFGWIHFCLDYDFTNMNLSVAIDQTAVYQTRLEKRINLRSVKISWKHVEDEYIFPETFTMVNIFHRYLHMYIVLLVI